MATNLAMKRMSRERPKLEQPNDDYFVHFNDDNLLHFEAYVVGPSDTLYSHKFVKLRFDIPRDYPLVSCSKSTNQFIRPDSGQKPPKVTFIQHSGNRIHPNLYRDGKVCLSILGTWSGEPWALAMTCETGRSHLLSAVLISALSSILNLQVSLEVVKLMATVLVLITIRSLLDNSPYKHEPHQSDNPAFNQYVQYTTWRWLLLDYLEKEQELALKCFLEEYVNKHAATIMSTVTAQRHHKSQPSYVTSVYEGRVNVDYPHLVSCLEKMIASCKSAVSEREKARLLEQKQQRAEEDYQKSEQREENDDSPEVIILEDTEDITLRKPLPSASSNNNNNNKLSIDLTAATISSRGQYRSNDHYALFPREATNNPTTSKRPAMDMSDGMAPEKKSKTIPKKPKLNKTAVMGNYDLE